MVNIGLVGKYVEMQDCYKSILEAFIHAGLQWNQSKCNFDTFRTYWCQQHQRKVSNLDAILVAQVLGKEE
jgi:CTP synthase